jgi:hypothetical protein
MRPPATTVRGTIAASMTRWNGCGFSLAKYSAAAFTSASVVSLAIAFMRA